MVAYYSRFSILDEFPEILKLHHIGDNEYSYVCWRDIVAFKLYRKIPTDPWQIQIWFLNHENIRLIYDTYEAGTSDLRLLLTLLNKKFSDINYPSQPKY